MGYTDAELGALYDAYQAKTAADPNFQNTNGTVTMEMPTFPDEAADQVYARAQADQVGTPGQRMFAGGMSNLLNALTFNYGNEITSGVNAGLDKISPFVPANQERSYDDYMNLTQSMTDQFRANNKDLSIPSDVIGGLLTPGLGLLKGAKTLPSIAKAAAIEGGTYGALAGSGDSSGGTYNRLVGALKGGAIGATAAPIIATGLTGLSKTLRPFTSGGQQRAASEAIGEALGNEGRGALAVPADPSSFGTKTLAEVSQSPSVANLEQQARMEIGEAGGSSLLANQTARQANRKSALGALTTDAFVGTATDTRGDLIRKFGQSSIDRSAKLQDQAWKAVGKTGQRIGVGGFAEQALSDAEKFHNQYIGYSQQTKKVLAGLKDENGLPVKSLTIEEWQKLRSAAGKAMTEASAVGSKEEAAAMYKVREALDAAAEKTANSTAPQAGKIPLIRRAIDITKKHKQTFETGTIKDIFSKGEGGFRYRETVAANKAISTPEGSRSFAKAFGGNKEAMRQAKGLLLDTMASKGEDTWVEYFNKNKGQFAAIFGEDFPKVKAVIEDLASEKSVGKLAQQATGRGSITGQKDIARKYLEGKIGGIFSRGAEFLGAAFGGAAGSFVNAPIMGSMGGVVAGASAKALEASGVAQIKKLIIKGLQDPEFARELLSKPTAGSLDRLMPHLQKLAALESGNLSGRDGSEDARKQLDQYKRQTANSRKMQEISAMRQAGSVDKGSPAASKGTATPAPTQMERKAITDQIENSDSLPNSNIKQDSSQQEYSRKEIKALVSKLPPIMQAVVKTESNFNHRAVSKVGAQGLAQLMPANSKKLGIKDPFDPVQNLNGGLKLLQEAFDQYKDPRIAIAVYNAGAPAIERAIKRAGGSKSYAKIYPYLPAETKAYVPRVLSNYRSLV
jgi:hypothetical protein